MKANHEIQSLILSLEYQRLLAENPGLEERLASLPLRVFSGKEIPKEGTQGVFFCYERPGKDVQSGQWSLEAGDAAWYLYRLSDGAIREEPAEIIRFIRCEPPTPRRCRMEQETLKEIRAKVEKHIKQTYTRRVNAPQGVKERLIAWMEIN